MTIKALLVDDQPLDLDWMCEALSKVSPKLEVSRVTNGDEAFLAYCKARHDLVITDWTLKGKVSGLDLAKRIKEQAQSDGQFVYVIMITGKRLNGVCEALDQGADDFLLKENKSDELLPRTHVGCRIINQVRMIKCLAAENDQLRKVADLSIDDEGLTDTNLSGKLTPILDRVEKAASADASVLIQGETGTGKELVAKWIHKSSPRREHPFVAFNCAVPNAALVESEIFGHEKGAFTGADGQRKGRLELANGGTLFLDEIGEMDLAVQAKLLRAIQEKSFERVGSSDSIRSDFRIVAATHQDLKKLVALGQFRGDLYYRLNVIPIEMPPLRERKDDIIPIATRFLAQFAQPARRAKQLSAEALNYLRVYHWPGNIRELRNIIERAVVLSGNDEVIDKNSLGLGLNSHRADPLPGDLYKCETLGALLGLIREVADTQIDADFDLDSVISSIERELVKVVYNSDMSKSEKAKRLGLSSDQYSRKVTKHHLHPKKTE